LYLYTVPSVFSLSQRKTDFVALTKNLTEIFLQSNDEKVLVNSALSLASLCEGDHARAVEAKTALKKTIGELRNRILVHLSADEENEIEKDKNLNSPGKATLKIESKDDSSTRPISKEIDKNYALYFNLKRIGVLSKRIDVSDYIGNNEDTNDHIEEFCNFICDGLAQRLTTYKVKVSGNDEGKGIDTEPKESVWKEKDQRLLRVAALVVHEGLQLLLSVIAWKVKSMQEEHQLFLDEDELIKAAKEHDKSEDDSDHISIRLKDRLIVLVELCFEQHLPESEEDDLYSLAQHEWSDSIQEMGGLIASDLRSLFMKEWSNASSPLLRAAAITEDSRLIAGYIRYFRSKESEMLLNSDITDKEKEEAARSLLLPLVRGLASNWKLGNRREASHALSHITSSGTTASEIVETFSRLLKRIEPLRLVEAHMASLRLSYEDWLNNDPEEMMGDNLTQGTDDETMNAFQELEKRHHEQFRNLLSQAQRFSQSLGVRKLSDKRLSPGLLGFIREGIRFSFSGSDDLLLGCRLSFLTVLCKYAQWIKRDKNHLWEVAQYLQEKESELKMQETDEKESAGEEFEGIHEDDLKALATFRTALGLEESSIFHSNYDDSASTFDTRTPDSNASNFGNGQHSTDDALDESRDSVSDMSAMTIPTSAKSRLSRGSVGSALSRVSSVRSSLSPLYEDGENEDDESPNSQTTQGTSAISLKSTGNKSELTEGEMADDDDDNYDDESPNTKISPGTTTPKSTGMKSELTEGGYESGSSLISPTAAKTQSTFDGEQSDTGGASDSDAMSEILETPH
jgi:cohesin complex subunit SA-1/2